MLFRWLRTLHAWGGATLALLVLLASVTGTLLVWKHEYVRLTMPEARTTFDATPEALAAIAAAVEAQFDNNEVLGIEFPTDRLPLARVILVDAHYAYLDGSGRIVDRWVRNERFEEWLFDLHHRLLLDNLGLTILGLAALALIVLVLAGVAAFWPARRGFRRGIWPRGLSRGQLAGAHRNLGVVLVLPLLLTLLTGALLAFPDEAEELLLEPFRSPDYSLDFSDHLDDISGVETGDWLPAIERSLASFPGARVRTASLPNLFSAYRVIGLQQPDEWNQQGQSRVFIDVHEGWMDIRMDPLNQHVSERLVNLAYPLHTARIDSLIYRLLLTLSGVLIATLSVFGLVSFVRRWVGRG